jgi:antitoxin component of RelBE/YafQ-DinJ toxin-antitoxin module
MSDIHHEHKVRVMNGKHAQITLTREFLEKASNVVDQLTLTLAGFIKMVISRVVEAEGVRFILKNRPKVRTFMSVVAYITNQRIGPGQCVT